MQQRPESLQKWLDGGHLLDIDGHRLFVHSSGKAAKDGDGVLVSHGYPGSSWDWSQVEPLVAEHTRFVVFDYLGFGHSDMPTDGR